MDVGLRPGKIIRHSLEELNALAEGKSVTRRETASPGAEGEILELLSSHDATGAAEYARQSADAPRPAAFRARNGDVAQPRGRRSVDARRPCRVRGTSLHEQLQVALRTGINAFPRQMGMPKVLLTTFPGEQHGLGLLMVEALLVPEGAQCISLGPQTPIEDIRRAAVAHDVQVVALSFSGAFPVRQAGDGLASLRRQLPSAVAIWAGGEMTRRIRKTLPGVLLVADIGGTVGALKAWRALAGAAASQTTTSASSR
jgi:methylmalonyl-CoA mutase cobalamin-binding subunit